jgi:cell division cycle protein 37
VPPKPEPPAVPVTKIDKSKKTKTEIEVLNPKVASSDQAPTGAAPSEEDQESGEEDALPELTPSLEAFSRLPLQGYEKSFEFIQSHRDVVVPGASDALLVAAFRAQSNDETLYAKQCVHQSLLLQYCEKLGGDGVRVFFKK